MKYLYYSVVFLFFIFLVFGLMKLNHFAVAASTEVVTFYHKNKIQVEKVKVDNPVLQKMIDEKIQTIKDDFIKKNYNNSNQPDFEYSLYITHEKFFTEKYISVVLFVQEYLGGAHPNHTIFTYVFDTTNNKLVTLDDIIKENKDFLIQVSKSVQGDLLLNPKITDSTWMMEGTRPKKENYQFFVFQENGILFYFPPYQVAPYSSGIIKVFIEV